jgi:hypothetical protein
MTKGELSILRESIKAVSHHNPHEWWELKREIYDSGYQSFYQAQLFFDRRARASVNALAPDIKTALVQLWLSAKPTREKADEGAILLAYGCMVVEEIVTRARIAAYRTESW